MSENPFLNALAAEAYIALIASLMFYGLGKMVPMDGVIVPIFMLSLFVFSASLMGLFFVYQPLRLLIEGKQKEATRHFLTTIASFACITVTIVLAWFFLSGSLN